MFEDLEEIAGMVPSGNVNVYIGCEVACTKMSLLSLKSLT